MSAEELRQAATTLREAAKNATEGPWQCLWQDEPPEGGEYGYWVAGPDRATVAVTCEDYAHMPPRDARLIALLGPDFALAVADWLEVTERDTGTSSTAYKAAEAIAALINGGAA